MHLKGVCWEVNWLFPIWKTVMTGRKRKKLVGLLLFPWGDFLRGESFWSLFYPVLLPTWEPGIPRSWCRSPGRVRHDSLLEIESPGRSRQVGLPRIGSPGRLRHVDFLDPWTGGSLSRLRHDSLLRTRFLGRSKQVDLLGPPDWSWASQGLQCDQCWVELRGCNSLLWMGIDIVM